MALFYIVIPVAKNHRLDDDMSHQHDYDIVLLKHGRLDDDKTLNHIDLSTINLPDLDALLIYFKLDL
jgi:hypothetical protein